MHSYFSAFKSVLLRGLILVIDVLETWYETCVSQWYKARPLALYLSTHYLIYFILLNLHLFDLIHCLLELHAGKSAS
jgi:hypothetical protein